MSSSRGLHEAASESHGARSARRAIEVTGLGKTYETRGGEVEAVRDVSFEVNRGEFVSLVGPSGCGKSTILHIVAGLLEHDSGQVTIGGAPAEAGRPDVGIMLQRPVLLPWRTVLENVVLPMEIFKRRRTRDDRQASDERARELLKLVGLEGFEDKHPWELSGGMQQRASLARVLVFEPEIFLMDEPFAALDEFTRERLNGELARLHESLGKTVLYVTHNIQESVFLSDRVAVMKPRPGEILEVVDIPLERPRRVEMVAETRTSELVGSIRRRLGFNQEETQEIAGG